MENSTLLILEIILRVVAGAGAEIRAEGDRRVGDSQRERGATAPGATTMGVTTTREVGQKVLSFVTSARNRGIFPRNVKTLTK